MPATAPKPCTVCQVLVTDGSARCMAHKPLAWAKSADAVKRKTGRALQRQREELFAREPGCRACSARGLFTLAKIRDHIKPLEEGGLDDASNIQPLCVPCHDEKTKTESARGGRRKFTAPRPETDLVVNFPRAQVLGVGGVS